MAEHVVLLSVPGLRESDLGRMPRLRALTEGGDRAPLVPSTPAVTCPVQVNLTTGALPGEHGVVGNGFFWRDGRGEHDGVEMWTAWNDAVLCPQLWDRLTEHDASLTSAVWFPLLAKGCGADFVCTPAPIHNPDGSESLWCYTKPEPMYGELRDALGHFPLKHFWGPLAGIQGSRWIVDSLLWLWRREKPNLAYCYLPHLDYAAQKCGPDSPEAHAACGDLDAEIGRLADGVNLAAGEAAPLWLIASEYAIVPVSRVAYPNRVLREAGLLEVSLDDEGRERIDFAASRAWTLVDHQTGHVFVRDRDQAVVAAAADALRPVDGIEAIWDAEEQRRQGVWNEERSADLLLVSEPHAWQAYYYWFDDQRAPGFARTVDIHRKPGYDPVEMFWRPDLAEQHTGGGVPLDATLVRGSHGAPARTGAQRGVLLSSRRGVFVEQPMADIDVCETALRQFGV